MPRRLLRVGTDYSGMETPLIALRALGVKFRHLFSSDICPKARLVIQEKFKPETLYGDVLKRNPAELPRKLDLYVAGFPCQAFSTINQSTGNHKSPPQPLRHFGACVKAIGACKPTVFVLENVPGLVSLEGGRYIAQIKRTLGKTLGCYQVAYLSLNARGYGSLQNRERLFIVGVLENRADRVDLPPPPPRPRPTQSFKSLLEKGATRPQNNPKRQKQLDACAASKSYPVFVAPNLVHLGCRPSRFPSCLTARGHGLYWSKRKIITTLREDMRLQGIPDRFRFPGKISDAAGRQLVGNAMSVDVLKSLFREVLKAC
jgi:site-specific DNA-cytosine methylase